MNLVKYKKPDVEKFRKVVADCGGNLSSVAKTFKVSRTTINNWMKADPEFKQVVSDERGNLFDACLSTSRILALGIPAYKEEEYLDENGNVRVRRVMDGWIERPDSNMLRYLLGVLGRKEEGFKEEVEDGDLIPVNGIAIRAWIKKENDG